VCNNYLAALSYLYNVISFAVYCNTLRLINDDSEDKFNTDKVEEVVKYLVIIHLFVDILFV